MILTKEQLTELIEQRLYEGTYKQPFDYEDFYEWCRVGYSSYTKPLTSYSSDGFCYSTYPKRVDFLNQCVRNIYDIRRNRRFRYSKPTELDYEIIRENSGTDFWGFEKIIPYLKTDEEILKRCNKNFLIEENIRSIFHFIIQRPPKNYFDTLKPTNTLEEFFVS